MSKFRGGVCDARCQQFHRERARKEQLLKNQWFIKNKQRLYDNLHLEDFSPKAKSTLQKRKLTESKKAPVETVKREPLPMWRPQGKDANYELMRPIKPAVKGILYEPKRETFRCKKDYLRERYKEKPEDRFYFPYCSSWEFGWRLQDYPPVRIVGHGAASVIQSSFYRRNASSLQRDPDWYRMCQAGDPKNFNEILTY